MPLTGRHVPATACVYRGVPSSGERSEASTRWSHFIVQLCKEVRLESEDLANVIQEFMAVTAVGGNALRNQEPGVVRAIQDGLRRVRLEGLAHGSADEYEGWLDSSTDAILRSFRVQVRVRPWGSVRKALNLFMRACICDHSLRFRYQLEHVEAWAEVPLDSKVANALREKMPQAALPTWQSLKSLCRDDHRPFQLAATELTSHLGFPARIYLDYHLWLRYR